MSEIAEVLGPPRFKTGKRLDKPAGLMNWHHCRPLNSLKNILHEQSRVYRAMINGVLPTSEGTRLVFVLKEIRCTWESLDAANAAALAEAKAAAAVQAASAPLNISITSIPSGFYQQPDGSFAPLTPEMLQIEHAPAPAPEKPAPEAELSSLGYDELLAQARQSGLASLSIEQLIERARQEVSASAPEPAPTWSDPADDDGSVVVMHPRSRSQVIPPALTKRPPTRAELSALSIGELMNRAGVSHVDQE